MKRLVASLTLLAAATLVTPAIALQPVEGRDLDHFVGTTLTGFAHAPLGVVSQVDRNSGVIGVAGRHGEFALLHTSVLARNGMMLRAPRITVADVHRASELNISRRGSTLLHPRIIIEEGPAG